MIRIKVMIFALLFAILGQPIAAIASDVTNALYSGTIVISNNSTANTNVATTANISTDNLIADDFLNATANNTVMRNSSGADVPFMPGYTDANLWSMWVPSIGADSYLTYILYTANSTGGEIRYFPGATGMTTLDSAGLELLGGTTNFSIIQSGWFNTAAGNNNLVNKLFAIRIATDSVTDEQLAVKVAGDTDCLDYVLANNDWTRIPDDPAFSFTDGAGNDEPFTLIAWMNFDGVGASSTLVGKKDGPGVQTEWWWAFGAGGELTLYCMNPAGVIFIGAQTVGLAGDIGTWHHYAATYDGSEANTGIEIFRDGINATNNRVLAGVYVGMTNGTEDVNIGSSTGGTGQYFDGQMAEAKVYAAELTPAEILADFEGGHKSASLVAWWKIDEGAGLPRDSSGNAHHATLNLADWVETFTERYTTETFASAVDTGEHVVEVAMEDEPAMALWATDVNVGVNMGNGILPVKLIEEITLDAAAASVTFSNIDTNVALWDSLAGVTSRHLVVMVNAISDEVADSRDLNLQFNGDGGANYNWQRLTGIAAAPAAFASAGVTSIQTGAIPATNFANAFGGGTILIPHAFNTSNHKSLISLTGAAEERVVASTGRWADINAIDTILLYPDAGNFDTGSTFLLGVIDERYLVEEQLVAVAGAIDFQNIPADGHDLVVIGYSQSDAAAVEDEIQHEFNNDAHGVAYPTQEITGRAAVTAAAQPNFEIGMTSGDNAAVEEFGALLATYSQYAEGVNQVHYTSLSGYHESTIPTSEVRAMSGRWGNVAAINRLEFYPATAPNQFLPGTLFSLYRVPRYVIDRQELTVAAATITFANIPQEYQALQLNVYARGTVAALTDTVSIIINTDGVDANFDNQELEGTGAGVPTATRILGLAGSRVIMLIPAANEGVNEFGGGTVTFPRYERTDGHKHFITLSGTQENQVILRSSRWENTASITDIDLDLPAAQTFAIGTIVELVGLMPTRVIDIDVDGDIKGLADGNFAIPNTTDDWTFVEAAAMPYMEYQEITINGTLQQDIVWEYDSVFHDTSYYGLEFDEANHYVNCGNGASLAFVDALTIEAWVKPSTLASVDPTALAIGKIDNWYFGFQQNNGFLRGRVYPAGEQTASADALVAGDWAHICLTYDGVNMNMYKNGAFVEAFAQVGLIGVGANSLNIGVGSPAPFAAFPGIVDEVRIYSRAALLAEITTNYNSGQGTYTPSDTTGLVGWWHMEEGTGLTTVDSSGNGNTGTLTNGPRWVNGHVPLPFGTSGTNDATPSFRTASSDPNVTANMTSFLPIAEAQAPAYALGPVNPFIEGTGNVTGNFTTTVVPPPGGFPLAGVIAAVAGATATPPQLPLLIIACFVILAASLTTTYLLRKYGSGSLLVKAFVIIGFMGIFIALGDFGIDSWMLIVFAIMATSLAMMSQQQGWQ